MSEDQDIAFKEGKAEGRDEAEREMRDEIERLRGEVNRLDAVLRSLAYEAVPATTATDAYRQLRDRAQSAADVGEHGVPPYLTTDIATQMLGYTEQQICDMVRGRELPAFSKGGPGGPYRIRRVDVRVKRANDNAQYWRERAEKLNDALRDLLSACEDAHDLEGAEFPGFREAVNDVLKDNNVDDAMERARKALAGADSALGASTADTDPPCCQRARAKERERCARVADEYERTCGELACQQGRGVSRKIAEDIRATADDDETAAPSGSAGPIAPMPDARDTSAGPIAPMPDARDTQDTARPTWAVVPSNPDATWFEIQRDGVTVARNIRDGRHAVALMRQLRCGGLVDTDVADFPEGKAEGGE